MTKDQIMKTIARAWVRAIEKRPVTEQPALFPGIYLDAINRQGETA